MIRKVKIITIITAALIISAGCAANLPGEVPATPSPLPPNPFAEAATAAAEQGHEYVGGYSIKPLDYDPFTDDSLVYDGTPIELSFQIEGDGGETNVGLVFFLDGAVQPHQVVRSTQTLDGLRPAEELQAVSVHRVAPAETVEITARFTPVTGKKGETLGFARLTMFKPLYLPASESETFGLLHDGHPYDWGTVRFEADAPGEVQSPAVPTLSEPIPESWKIVNESNPTGRIKNPTFRLNDGTGEFMTRLHVIDGKAPLRVQLWGGAESDYRVTVFVNHVPVKINGSDSFIIRSLHDQIVSYEFELDLPADLPRLNSLYATSLPVGEGYLANPEGGNKTGSALLINDAAGTDRGDPAEEAAEAAPGAEAPPVEAGDADLSAALLREGIRSEVLHLSALDDGRLLLGLSDRAFILDAATGEILNRAPFDFTAGTSADGVREAKFLPFAGGFAVFFQTIAGGPTRSALTLYDDEAVQTAAVPLHEFFAVSGDHLPLECALSASGRTLACGDPLTSDLLIRDLDSEAAAKRIGIGDALAGGNFEYRALAFADDDRCLAFTGLISDAGTYEARSAYGILDLENGKVARLAPREYLNDRRIQAVAGRVLFTESRGGEADFGTGAVTLIRLPGGEAEEIPFVHNNGAGLESYTVSLSPTGRYYAGYALEWDRDADAVRRVTIWIYDAETMTPVAESAIDGGSLARPLVAFNERESAYYVAYADAADDWQLRLVRREIP